MIVAGGITVVLLALALARWVWMRAKKPTIVQVVEDAPRAREPEPAPDAPVIERIEQATPDDAIPAEPPLPPTRIVFDDPEVIEALDRAVAAQAAATRQKNYEPSHSVEPIE
ncbi:MAG: hypothetical protein HZC40_00795 [Chloroflexi bacterium]|nr:hypothetical protein [Chloroflexota bacterium]